MFKSNYTVMEMIFQNYPPGFEALITILLGVLIVALVILVAMMVWVYKDAQKRNMNAAVWLLIVFVAGPCGCVIYLMVREPERPLNPSYQQQPSFSQQPPPVTTGSNIYCPSCGRELSKDTTFCTGCGSKIR